MKSKYRNEWHTVLNMNFLDKNRNMHTELEVGLGGVVTILYVQGTEFDPQHDACTHTWAGWGRDR